MGLWDDFIRERLARPGPERLDRQGVQSIERPGPCLAIEFETSVSVDALKRLFGGVRFAAWSTWDHQESDPRSFLLVAMDVTLDAESHRVAMANVDAWLKDAGLYPKRASLEFGAITPPMRRAGRPYVWAAAFEVESAPVRLATLTVAPFDPVVAFALGPELEPDHHVMMDRNGERIPLRAWAAEVRPGGVTALRCPHAESAPNAEALVARRLGELVHLTCDGDGHGHPIPWTRTFRLDAASDVTETGAVRSIANSLDVGGKSRKLARPAKTLENVLYVLEHDPKYAGKVWFDAFSEALMLEDREFNENDNTDIRIWMSRTYRLEPTREQVYDVAALLGRNNCRNGVVEYLGKLEWDGVNRLDGWLTDACGVESTELTRELARKWMIQAVARALTPGCKADTLLVLVGPQGYRKSSVLRALAGDEWFSDTRISLGDKDAFMQIRMAWIYEFQELEAIKKATADTSKGFITSCEDRFRPPYDRFTKRFKRHCVFCGTVNDAEFLGDATGSRRYWPVTVTKLCDTDWVRTNRDQLWAEAVHRFRAGEAWYLDQATEANLERASRRFKPEHPWVALVQMWLEIEAPAQPQTFTAAQVMSDALAIAPRDMRRYAADIGQILRDLGCEAIDPAYGQPGARTWLRPKNVVHRHAVGGP